jgi:hypothetical protein
MERGGAAAAAWKTYKADKLLITYEVSLKVAEVRCRWGINVELDGAKHFKKVRLVKHVPRPVVSRFLLTKQLKVHDYEIAETATRVGRSKGLRIGVRGPAATRSRSPFRIRVATAAGAKGERGDGDLKEAMVEKPRGRALEQSAATAKAILPRGSEPSSLRVRARVRRGREDTRSGAEAEAAADDSRAENPFGWLNPSRFLRATSPACGSRPLGPDEPVSGFGITVHEDNVCTSIIRGPTARSRTLSKAHLDWTSDSSGCGGTTQRSARTPMRPRDKITPRWRL